MSVPSKFRPIVGAAAGAAGGVGVPGAFAFGADVPVLLCIWVAGAGAIIEEAGHSASDEQLKALATSALAGAASFVAGSKIAAKLFHVVPGPGTVAAICVNSTLDAFFTYRFLRSVAKVYDSFDSEEMIWQNLQNGFSFFSIWTVVDDVKDMAECISEGSKLIADFNW
jgi:hypothetical protein